MNTYNYKAYGLKIQSEIELPELTPYKGTPDVNIRIGNIKEKLHNPLKKGIRYEVNKSEFLLKLDNIARFYAKNGEEIIIEPFKNYDTDDLRLFLLGSVFGALLHQRSHFVLHASTIETIKGAISFTGISGAGKSTLTKAFAKKGYKVLSDDVTSITFSEEEIPFVTPGFDKIKLWEDSAKHLGEDLKNARRIRKEIQKYNIKLGDSFSETHKPLKAIFILNTDNNEEITHKKIESFYKIQALINNTYRMNFIGGEESHELHLKQCGKISSAVEIFRITRPKNKFVVEEMIELIEKEMGNL